MLDHRTRWLGVLIVALVGLVFAPAAHGQTSSFIVDFSPEEVTPGTEYTFEVSIQNTSSKHSLGSANLYAPAAFGNLRAKSISKGSISAANGVVEARNLSLKFEEVAVLKFSAIVHPKACGNFEWNARAKHPSDFHPNSHDMVLDRQFSDLSIQTTADCELEFLEQPAAARVGDAIRGEAFKPTSSKIIAVKLRDANGGTSLASSTVTMTLAEANRGNGQLVGTVTESVINGVASFDDIRVTEPGGYRLVATTGGGTIAQSGSNSFTVETDAVFCAKDEECTLTISRSDIVPAASQGIPLATSQEASTADSTTDTNFSVQGADSTITTGTVTLEATALPPGPEGTLMVSLFNYALHDCLDYPEPAVSDGRVYGLPRRKRVSLTYSSSLLAGRTAGSLEACFAAPYAFLSKGIPSTADTDSDKKPDSFSATLHDCSLLDLVASVLTYPCVVRRLTLKDQAGNVVGAKIIVEVPENPLDPMYR